MRPLVALLVLAGLTSAAPVPKGMKAKKDDAALIVGTWKQVDGGREWFRFEADGTASTWVTERPGSPLALIYAFVPDATPKRMTWTYPGHLSPAYRCLFEIDGDTLRLNYLQAGDLPESVDAAGGRAIRLTRDTSGK